jgi:diguanylate cyclase (GGDEF)-like protein
LNYARAGFIGGLACLLVTAIGTYIIALRFQRTIIGHIAAIANVAHDVRLHRRFDRRVEVLPVAELNRLGKDVNALLDELADWQQSEADEKAVLARRAHLDPLTGLPNRAALDAHLDEKLAIKDGTRPDFALLYLDIDRFKQANDQFGHAAGDAILQAVARRLMVKLQPGDLAARLGGDEFVVVTSQERAGANVERFSEDLFHAIAEPVDVGPGINWIPSASIGIARCPGDGMSAAALLNAADMAMYRAKQSRTDLDRR